MHSFGLKYFCPVHTPGAPRYTCSTVCVLMQRPVFDAACAPCLCAQLTELKAMLGVCGELRTVAGFLTQPEEGRWAQLDCFAS
jgi:hypothetical protein